MGKGDNREIILLEELKKRQRLDVGEAQELLKVSEATLRRLFARLETEQKLLRIHGGIQAVPQLMKSYSFLESARRNTEFKSLIGKIAVAYVNDGDRIFLDAGTTVLSMAEELCLPLRMGVLKKLTVVTNSLSLVNSVAAYCETILIGGRIRPDRNDVCGPIACENLRKYHFDKVFFGVDGIAADGRLMTTDQETAAVNAAFLELADRRIVLADGDKFDRTSFVTFSTLTQVDQVITDRRLSEEMRRRYAQFPAQLRVVADS